MVTAAESVSEKSYGRVQPISLAYSSLLTFVIIYFARPGDWIPELEKARLALIAGTLAVIAFGFTAVGSKGALFRVPREIGYLVLLFVQLLAAALLSPVWRGGAFDIVVYTFSKIVLISVVIALTVRTLGRLRKLIFVQTFSIALIAMVSILEAQRVAGRLTGALSGIYGNPNDLAFAIALATPLGWTLLHRTTNPLKKLFWSLSLVVMAYAVLRTASRGGLITLVAAVLICLWEFGIKGNRRYLVAIAAMIGVAIAAFGPTRLLDLRLGSLLNPSDNQSSYESFEQRRGLLMTSVAVTFEHPLFGVGPGNFQVVSGNWHVAHNSITELGAEGGIAALVLIFSIFRLSFANLRKARKSDPGEPEIELWCSGLRASLLVLVIGSFFASVEYQFFPYMVVAYASVLPGIAGQMSDQRSEETEMPSSEVGKDRGHDSPEARTGVACAT